MRVDPPLKSLRMKLSDFHHDTPVNDVAGLKRSISNKLVFTIGKDPVVAKPEDWLRAASMAVRDRLVERWMLSTRAQHEHDVKRAYYLSAEFLIGRTFTNALLALGIHDNLRQALAELDVDFDAIVDLEPDAALGNGGLGRLAACFLDSMATIGVPGMGYGIRYDYGMFRQRIVDGRQVETPDYWLVGGNPWEFPRPEIVHRVRFGGHLEHHGDDVRWVGTQDVLAMAYDTIIPGYDTPNTITLRLWSARATSEIDLSAFNQGNYMGAVEGKNHSENVSRVLYPDDSTVSGRELRLRQEYFFCSASLQDLVHRFKTHHERFTQLPDKVAIHLNDTHPVLAVPELVRILMDEHGLPFAAAWDITRQCFGYTNHTLMHEALETWPVEMLGRVLPRHLKIIFDINDVLMADVNRRSGIADPELMRRISLIDEHGDRRVRMAYLAVVASRKINGVSKLHSELMKQSIFADFAGLYPERFNNKTNGITPRRWLSQANRPLSALVDSRIGTTWRRDLDELVGLRPLVDDAAFVAAFRSAKRQNKERMARWVNKHLGISLNLDSLFDVQIKRIHEYKRQLLNVLHVITRYNRIKADPDANVGAAHRDLRGQGCVGLSHGQADHQAGQRRCGGRQQRPRSRRQAQGRVHPELQRQPGRNDHPGR